MKKDGDKVCVYKKDADGNPTGKSLGCHESASDAKDQIKAMYAQEGFHFQEATTAESLDERISDIRRAAYDKFNKPQESNDIWVRDVLTDNSVIMQVGQDEFKVGFSVDGDGKVSFDERDKWEKVELKYVTVKESELVKRSAQEGEVVTIYRSGELLGPLVDAMEREMYATQ